MCREIEKVYVKREREIKKERKCVSREKVKQIETECLSVGR